MQVNLVRRWGNHQPGDKVTVDNVQGRWLVDHHFAETAKGTGSASQGAVAEGEAGPDPIASGDATRRSMRTRKGSRDGNRAAPVAGSPVTFTPGVVGDSDGSSSAETAAGEPAEAAGAETATRKATTSRRKAADSS